MAGSAGMEANFACRRLAEGFTQMKAVSFFRHNHLGWQKDFSRHNYLGWQKVSAGIIISAGRKFQQTDFLEDRELRITSSFR